MPLARNKQIILSFLKDKHKKNWAQIIKEFTSLYVAQKQIPVNYITSLLFRKNVLNYKDYITIKENQDLLAWSYAEANEQIELVENKLLFNKLLVKNNIPTPQIIFHNLKNSFTYNDETFRIATKKDFFLFLERVFDEVNIQRLFCKPTDGSMGKNIFVIDKNKSWETPDELINIVFSGSFIFQKPIIQHESLSKINHSSVNTLRIVAYKDQDHNVEIICGFIRLGRKGAVVDNAHAGGIVVPFDKDTGKMKDEGLQLIDNGGGIFYQHPETGIIFDNFQIPYYDQVKALVVEASALFKFPLLGWDIAITPQAPTIVEANHNFHLLLSDRMDLGLKRNPTINKLLEALK